MKSSVQERRILFMKEKQRKIMGLIISFVMIITIMPQTIWASDAGSREDAVKWAYAQEGKFLDYDKVYGCLLYTSPSPRD